LEIDSTELPADPTLARLHAGERSALLLAENVSADVMLLDEKAARAAAVARGLGVVGLLGVLREAADRGLVALPSAVEDLLKAGFRTSPALLRSVLERPAPPRPPRGKE